MKILVTAGGTSERIDNVRSITNHSTGRLGKAIAEEFLAHNHQVTYLTTPYAVKPTAMDQLIIEEIETTADLQKKMLELLSTQTFDGIIHSMAVSDFSSETSLPEEALIQAMTTALTKQQDFSQNSIETTVKDVIEQLGTQQQEEKKISSNTERLLLFLKKNPKIISMIRENQPNTVLVGFKLLVGVSEDELIQVGSATLKKNQCDFVLANDLESIRDEKHRGILIHADGQTETAETKAAIAELIVKNVEAKGANNS
ncbi:phosphopantothenate--cysteine ligase [Enterococcus sp. BWR-S5]|uniref:phosphopantothenate--cysteine ligase n=1 Tax=Enterococcus sp. BWR-S5 TaxID=2787714 RepID=UPI001924FA60|nr:phosphopantothenate--cysteine ligase [Enterococcus sp. BWR-S5]MBL1226389.1 phosphopantothenate--cysteine ligase [Enterococcus sp. BWR-S5]